MVNRGYILLLHNLGLSLYWIYRVWHSMIILIMRRISHNDKIGEHSHALNCRLPVLFCMLDFVFRTCYTSRVGLKETKWYKTLSNLVSLCMSNSTSERSTGWKHQISRRRTSGSQLQRNMGNSLRYRVRSQCRSSRLLHARIWVSVIAYIYVATLISITHSHCSARVLWGQRRKLKVNGTDQTLTSRQAKTP